MKSIDFPGATLKIGGNQTDIYNVIHAYPLNDGRGEVLAIYELTEEEAERIFQTRKIYYSRLTFGNKFQPMRISAEPIEVNIQFNDHDGKLLPEIHSGKLTDNGMEIVGFKRTGIDQFEKI